MAGTNAETTLDVLVVGGGPAGTAAAFRARELGLEALVIDYDDLMKRIRDYSKDKLILPDFGGGDQMRFPKGGDLVAALRFGPIDKDQMVDAWKKLYAGAEIASRTGVELTGLEAREDGSWLALAWDHKSGCDATFAARHVVIAIGRGVPRRFDIPGNTDGVAYRLADPAVFVGQPACVVGGGTSAAEAVIAISQAKAEAGDPTAVYWSYRGDKMPRVSKALADAFFAAYVGNGNIRYKRRSEPVAVVTGDDRREYVAIRVDRRCVEDRPPEVSMLEFPKQQCIACIGEDIPETLLVSLGIPMVVGGPRDRKRMVVNRYLETCRPNVYLAGDLLSQAYFETEDFSADPAGFREIKHRGNVKSALRDGVLVAQVISQRLKGATEIDIQVEDAEETESRAGSRLAISERPASAGLPDESLAGGRIESGKAGGEATLVRILPTGVEEDEYPVRLGGVTTIGSGECDLSFPSDSMLAAVHGSISHNDDGFFLRDDGSSTGVFYRVPAARKMEVADRDLIRLGRQFLVFSIAETGATVTHHGDDGVERNVHELREGTIVVGRDAPDITLDANDSTLSRRHLAVSVAGARILVKDLKSVNGSYLRVRTAIALSHGDEIRLGQQWLRFSESSDAVLDAGHSSRVATPGPEGKVVPEVRGDGATVTFQGAGAAAVDSGQTICEAAEEHGVAINAECHSGVCGSDPVRILAGAENLVGELGDQERETLEEICEVEPGKCRLACMVGAKGPVKVEIL